MDKKATENELSSLHAVVAKVLKEQLQAETTLIGEDGEEVKVSLVTPAMVGQAIKFLKDNNITTTIEAGDDLDDLQEMLNNKPKHGRAQLRAVSAKAAASE